MSRVRPLGEVCRVVPGFAFKSADLRDAGIPVVKIGSITDAGNVDLASGQFLPLERLEDRHKKYLLNRGDIVLAMTGEGKVGRITDDQASLLNQRVCKLEPIDETDRMYLWVVVKSMDYSRLFAQLAQGAAQANISGGQIEAISVEWPEPEARRQIARIASAYDDLIENNRRRIKLLEESAHLLYREWFVHLRFPGHEHVKVVDGVPEGWEQKALGDVLTLQRGFDLPAGARVEGEFPIYAATGVHGCHNKAMVSGPGVITGRSGSLGKVSYSPGDFWPLNTALWVKEFKRVAPEFAYFLLSILGLEQYNGGVAVPTLNRNDVHRIQVNLPPQSLMDEFNEFALLQFKQVATLTQQNDKLHQARNLLLPRLMSGEVVI